MYIEANMEEIERQKFNRELNISWVDENLPKADNTIILKHYFSSLVVYGIVLLFIWFNPFFSKMLAYPLKVTFNYFYLYYMFGAPIIYICFRPKSLWRSHNLEIMRYFHRILTHRPNFKNLSAEDIKTELEFYKPKYYEQQSLVLIFIKVFFGTQMLSIGYSNIHNVILPKITTYNDIWAYFVQIFSSFQFDLIKGLIFDYKEFLYSQSIIILYTIDVSIFTFGYFTELSIFKNKIRTVETTPAGLFFCLACYAPFFNATNSFLGWKHNDHALAFADPNSPVTWIFRICALFFLVIYVSASAALGTKGSNLTNRGTVSRFPYSVVRHPAYITKVMFWFLTTVPLFIVHFSVEWFSWKQYLSNLILTTLAFICLASIYYFRALTEERHLIKDPDYQDYVKKVKYRFIPFVI